MLRNTKFFNRGTILLLCAALALGLSLPISAASNTLNLTNVEVTNKSETTTVEDLDYAYNSLTGNIRLKQINDSITLALTLENISDITYEITGIEDNITGDYMSTEYSFDKGKIAPGETTTVNAAITYTNTKDSKNNFKISDYSIIINLISVDGESQLVINPGTGDSIIGTAVIITTVSIFGIAALVLIKNKRTKTLITVFLALSGATLLSTTIYADTTHIAEVRIMSIAFGEKTLSDITTMQEMTHAICEASETYENNLLIDTRENNNNDYIVRKAADGKCWMAQNLRLGSSLNIGDNLAIDKINNTTGEVDGEFILTGKIANTESFTNNSGTNDSPQFTCREDYGCYYNWATATAGTRLASLTTGDASSSICPKGWTLPTANQYLALLNADPENTSANRIAKDTTNSSGVLPGFTLGGFYPTTIFGTEQHGFYWTREANSDSTARYIGNDPSYTGIGTYPKYFGQPIRCVAY